jgi:hypothetical protein
MEKQAERCGNCRYWSEMIARIRHKDQQLEAVCLSKAKKVYKTSYETCDSWASDHLGAIDEPDSSPDRYNNESASN